MLLLLSTKGESVAASSTLEPCSNSKVKPLVYAELPALGCGLPLAGIGNDKKQYPVWAASAGKGGAA
jgi:hypothetical protein